MKKIYKILITITWLIAFISVLFNLYFEIKVIRLQEENNRLKEEIVGGTNS